jgi:hypothetical protein
MFFLDNIRWGTLVLGLFVVACSSSEQGINSITAGDQGGGAGSAASQAGAAGQSNQAGFAGNAGGAAGSAGTAGSSGGSGSAGQSGSCILPESLALSVANFDLFRYPPYASEGCRLVYLEQQFVGQAGTGILRLRQLDTGEEQILAEMQEQPKRPSISDSLVVWEAVEGGKSVVRVWKNGQAITLQGNFDHAGEPRVSGNQVVFTSWSTSDPLSDTDVWFYSDSTQTMTKVASGPGQQRFADIAGKTVVYTDFSEDPDGVFNDDENDLADITAVELGTGSITPHPLPGKQAFPQVANDLQVVYMSWPEDHPEPKLQAYGLRLWNVGTKQFDLVIDDVSSLEQPTRPDVTGGLLVWISKTESTPYELKSMKLDLSSNELGTLTTSAGWLTTPVIAGNKVLSADTNLQLHAFPL